MFRKKRDKSLAKCRRIVISPQDAVIDAGASQSFTCEGFDKWGNSLGNITALTQFTISQGADGSWNRNIYTSENMGNWQITASYKGKLATATLEVLPSPEPPEPVPTPEPIPPPEPLPVPQPIQGRLYEVYNQVGQLGDKVAFPYSLHTGYGGEMNEGLLWYDGISYPIPGDCYFGGNWYYRIKTIIEEDGVIWLAYQPARDAPITVRKYQIVGSSLEIVDTYRLGTSLSRIMDFISLADGTLVLAFWEQEKVDGGIPITFAWFNGIEWSQISDNLSPAALAQCNGSLCQHPVDGSVWYFQTIDASSSIWVIHLVQSNGGLVIDWKNNRFLSIDNGLMRPDPELPWIVSVVDGDSIYIAYQNITRQHFGGIPSFIVSKVVVVKVAADGTCELVEETPCWLQRTRPFSLGIIQGQFWLAYGRVNFDLRTWDELYRYRQGGEEEYLDKLVNDKWFSTGNSKDWIIASMDDGYIHFYAR